MLKVGFIAARVAGLPMPDLSALIPEDLREITAPLVDLQGISFDQLSQTAQVGLRTPPLPPYTFISLQQ